MPILQPKWAYSAPRISLLAQLHGQGKRLAGEVDAEVPVECSHPPSRRVSAIYALTWLPHFAKGMMPRPRTVCAAVAEQRSRPAWGHRLPGPLLFIADEPMGTWT